MTDQNVIYARQVRLQKLQELHRARIAFDANPCVSTLAKIDMLNAVVSTLEHYIINPEGDIPHLFNKVRNAPKPEPVDDTPISIVVGGGARLAKRAFEIGKEYTFAELPDSDKDSVLVRYFKGPRRKQIGRAHAHTYRFNGTRFEKVES